MQRLLHVPISIFIRFAGWVVRHVNERTAFIIGNMIITLIFLPQYARRIGNIDRVFSPLGWSHIRLKNLSRRNVRYCSDFIIEVIRLATLSNEELENRIHCHGEEHLKNALAQGQGVFLLGSHLGNWWYARAFLALKGYRIANVASRLPVDALEKFLQEIRSRFGIRTTYIGEGGQASAEETIQSNGIFSVLVDITTPQRESRSEWIPLGRATIHADLGPAKLVLNHPCTPVLWLEVKRIGRGRHELNLIPVTTSGGNPPDQRVHLTCEWMNRLYQELLERPELWWHWSYLILRENAENTA